MNGKDTYSATQIALHWAIAILVVAAWFTSDGMGRLLRQKIEGTLTGGMPLHVVIGLAVLALVLLRVVIRLLRGGTAATEGTPHGLARARHWGHIAIYVLLAAVPLGGALTWFFGLRELGDLHGLAANLLLIVAGAHSVLALWHHYVLRDGTLMRMLRPG